MKEDFLVGLSTGIIVVLVISWFFTILIDEGFSNKQLLQLNQIIYQGKGQCNNE